MFEKLEKIQFIWLAVILALGLICAVNLATRNISNDKITVTGSAYKNVQADSARMVFEVTARKADKQQAYNTVKSQMPIIKEYLKEKGLTNIDVKAASGYYSYKYAPNGNSTNEIAYYNITQEVEVKSPDVQKIKEVSTDIQNLLEKGIDINYVNTEYFYSKLGDLKVELLRDATSDAKNRAAAMLKATHNKPGKIQSVQMGVFQITPVDSTNVSDMGINDTSTIDKKVTAVANIVFRIK